MKRALIILSFFMVLRPIATRAAETCCMCGTPEYPRAGICILTETTNCATLPAETKNKTIQTYTCVPVTGICKAVNESGVCQAGPPQKEAEYVPTSQATEPTRYFKPPELNVEIKGLKLAENVKVDPNGYLSIPYLGQYIAAIYQFLIGISIVATAIAFVYGGFLYLVGSTVGKVSSAKKIITDAAIGLVILLGAQTILRTINPAVLKLDALRINDIRHYELQAETFARFGTTDMDKDPFCAQKAAGKTKGSEPHPSLLQPEIINPNLNTPGPAEKGDKPTVGTPGSSPKEIPFDGSCPPPANKAGIDAWDRVQAACGGDGSLATLKKTIEVWKLEAIDHSGLGYVRGGTGGGKSLTLFPPQPGFMLAALYKTAPSARSTRTYNFLSGETRNACGIADGLEYSGVESAAAISDAMKTTLSEYAKGGGCSSKIRGNVCFKQLMKDYEDRIIFPIKCNNMIGTDCGLFVNQVLKCAGVTANGGILSVNTTILQQLTAERLADPTAKQPKLSEGGKITIRYLKEDFPKFEIASPSGKKIIDFKKGAIVSARVCEKKPEACEEKIYPGYFGWGKKGMIAAMGGIRGGAMVGIGCGAGISHYFLYTGGMGLPYETFESGGASTPKEYKGNVVQFPGYLGDPNFRFGGGGVAKSFKDYIEHTSCGDNDGWMFYVNNF